MDVNFLRGGKLGEKLVVRATVDKMGKSIVYSSCEVFNEKSGKMMYKG